MAEVELAFVVLPAEAFGYLRIADDVRRMRELGMSLRAIGSTLGVDEKTVRKALGRLAIG